MSEPVSPLIMAFTLTEWEQLALWLDSLGEDLPTPARRIRVSARCAVGWSWYDETARAARAIGKMTED